MVRDFAEDYKRGEADLAAFFHYPITNIDIPTIIKDKSFSTENRETLYHSLLHQYQGKEISTQTQENIASLRHTNTFTFTTGHQACCMGGPLFTIYKILTVIRLAEKYNLDFPEYRFVPIFWLHTEDHDFEEINHFYENFHTKKIYSGQFVGAVGRHVLSTEIEEMIPPHFPQILAECFVAGKTWGEAHLDFFQRLFDVYGLVILDADSSALKRIFTPIVQAELLTQATEEYVAKATEALRAAHYNVPIKARPINLFHLTDAGRNLIEVEINENQKKFIVKNTPLVFSEKEILELSEAHPESFSPNVCLRPLYQEMILPNLAYIGGWAEVNYWMQLRDVFTHFKVNFPLVLPRFSGIIWSNAAVSAWEELGLTDKDILLSLSEIEKKKLLAIWDNQEWEMVKQNLLSSVEQLQGFLSTQTPNLPHSTIGHSRKTAHFAAKIEKKLYKQLIAQHREVFEEIRKVKNQIQPEGTVQERVLSLAAFPNYSPFSLIALLYASCNPFAFRLTKITI